MMSRKSNSSDAHMMSEYADSVSSAGCLDDQKDVGKDIIFNQLRRKIHEVEIARSFINQVIMTGNYFNRRTHRKSSPQDNDMIQYQNQRQEVADNRISNSTSRVGYPYNILSREEKKVLNIFNYYNWTAGVLTTVGSAGILWFASSGRISIRGIGRSIGRFFSFRSDSSDAKQSVFHSSPFSRSVSTKKENLASPPLFRKQMVDRQPYINPSLIDQVPGSSDVTPPVSDIHATMLSTLFPTVSNSGRTEPIGHLFSDLRWIAVLSISVFAGWYVAGRLWYDEQFYYDIAQLPMANNDNKLTDHQSISVINSIDNRSSLSYFCQVLCPKVIELHDSSLSPQAIDDKSQPHDNSDNEYFDNGSSDYIIKPPTAHEIRRILQETSLDQKPAETYQLDYMLQLVKNCKMKSTDTK